MFPILFKCGPNKEGLPQPALLYLVGGCHLDGKAIYCRRARPSSSGGRNGPRQGINGDDRRPETRAPHSAHPSAPGARRLPLGPDATCGKHVVAAAMRGARSRGPAASTRGRSPTRGLSDGGAAMRKECRPRVEHSCPGPRPSRFLESSACRGARPDGRRGEEGGGERRPRARHRRRHEEGARPPLFPPPAR